MGLIQRIASGWQRRGPQAVMLLPLAAAFAFLVNVRRLAYRFGWAAAVKLPVPVVVIGNITAGGSGKTPLTLYLAQELAGRGWRPGIVSRGYGGSATAVEAVSPESDPELVGDEPLLLARRAGCPVFVGRDRVAAAKALLSACPECNVVIADDGLQHMRLARDVEIVVMDGRGIGNGWPLPSGPLRECPARLAAADALVLNGDASVPAAVRPRRIFRMRLAGERFRSLRDPQRSCAAADLRGRRLHAVAGIGEPARFFRQLEGMGLQVVPHAYPDHHAFVPSDLAFAGADALLMTEKDAVKCASLDIGEAWMLPVEAVIGCSPPGQATLFETILEKLHGRTPA